MHEIFDLQVYTIVLLVEDFYLLSYSKFWRCYLAEDIRIQIQFLSDIGKDLFYAVPNNLFLEFIFPAVSVYEL